MLENNYNELADKGWNELESILAKEMPIKPDRRWLIFFLLFACLVGASGLYVLSRSSESEGHRQENLAEVKERSKQDFENKDLLNQNSVEQEGENPDGSILSAVKNEISNNVNGHFDEEQNQNEQSSTISQGSKLDVAVQREQESNKKATPLAGKKKIQLGGETEESLIVLVDEDKSRINIIPKNLDIEILGSEEVIAEADQLITEVRRKTNSEVAGIGTREISNLVFDKQNQLIGGSLNLVKVRHPLYMSLYGGYSIPLASQISGPYAGFEVGRNFSRRWVWSANLGVNMATNNFSRSFSQQDASVVFDPTEIQSDPNADIPDSEVLVVAVTDGGVSLNEQYYDLVAERLGRLYYIDLGLNARYSISQRNEVGLGLNYSYLVSSVTDYISLSEFANSLSLRNGGLRRDVLIQTNLINRHNISVLGTYQYQVTKRLNLHLRFNLGLNQIIKVQEVSDYRNRLNYVGIGLGYKLKV